MQGHIRQSVFDLWLKFFQGHVILFKTSLAGIWTVFGCSVALYMVQVSQILA